MNFNYLKGAHECLVHAHHGASVVELTAVVRGREKRHQLSLCKELVSILHHLRVCTHTHTHTHTQRGLTYDTHKHQYLDINRCKNSHIIIKIAVFFFYLEA